jgi:FixJ family two-component response regulator
MRSVIACITADSAIGAHCQDALKSLPITPVYYVDLRAFLSSRLKSEPDLLVMDDGVLAGASLDDVASLKHLAHTCPLLLLTCDGAVDAAVSGIRLGATDCLEKSAITMQLVRRVYKILNPSSHER